jgi:hypothetical protein
MNKKDSSGTQSRHRVAAIARHHRRGVVAVSLFHAHVRCDRLCTVTICVQSCEDARTPDVINSHTHAHTHTRHARTHTHATHAHTHAHTDTHSTRTHTRAHIHAHTHTRTRAHTHTLMHTHERTHRKERETRRCPHDHEGAGCPVQCSHAPPCPQTPGAPTGGRRTPRSLQNPSRNTSTAQVTQAPTRGHTRGGRPSRRAMPAAPPPKRARGSGQGGRPSRLFGAGSMVSTPCSPASKIPKGWGASPTAHAGTPATVY